MSFGQSLSPGVFNYGKVKLWNNPRATFTFTNPSNKRVLFLPIPYQRNLYVNLPEGYIEPGETVELEAIFYTEDLGNFTVNQPLYLSGWGDPIYLNLKGKIISFHPDAHTACPNMGQEKREEATSQIARVVVKDKQTGEILTGVDILLVGTSHNYFIEKTKKAETPLKKVPIGLYQIDIAKKGYVEKKELLYLNKNTEVVIFELERNQIEEVLTHHTPEIEESTSEEVEIVEIEKPKESDQDAIERIRRRMNERFSGRTIIERDVMVVKEPSDSLETDEDLEETIDDDGGFAFDEREPKPEETPLDTTPAVERSDFNESGELNPEKYVSNNVVFLIDESSSMMVGDKMVHLQASMRQLVGALRKQDLVTIVVYSRDAEVRLAATPGDQKKEIYKVIDALKPGGRSYGAQGLSISYDYARQNFIPKGNNQIILATDGLFNSPQYSPEDLYAMAKNNADEGVRTTVVGFGKDKKAIEFMQVLSHNGEGSFVRIKTAEEAQQALLMEVMQNALR